MIFVIGILANFFTFPFLVQDIEELVGEQSLPWAWNLESIGTCQSPALVFPSLVQPGAMVKGSQSWHH
jgi:hypothetical protein